MQCIWILVCQTIHFDVILALYYALVRGEFHPKDENRELLLTVIFAPNFPQ